VEFQELLFVCWPLSSARENNRMLLKTIVEDYRWLLQNWKLLISSKV